METSCDNRKRDDEDGGNRSGQRGRNIADWRGVWCDRINVPDFAGQHRAAVAASGFHCGCEWCLYAGGDGPDVGHG